MSFFEVEVDEYHVSVKWYLGKGVFKVREDLCSESFSCNSATWQIHLNVTSCCLKFSLKLLPSDEQKLKQHVICRWTLLNGESIEHYYQECESKFDDLKEMDRKLLFTVSKEDLKQPFNRFSMFNNTKLTVLCDIYCKPRYSCRDDTLPVDGIKKKRHSRRSRNNILEASFCPELVLAVGDSLAKRVGRKIHIWEVIKILFLGNRKKALTEPCGDCCKGLLEFLNNSKTVDFNADRNEEESLTTNCPFDGLCEDISKLCQDQKCMDVTLKCEGKKLEAHRVVLAARSNVFADMFQHDTTESLTGVVNIPDVDATTLKDMLDYAYRGKVEDMSLDKAKSLYVAADKYTIDKLKAFCREYLLDNLSVEVFYDIAILADDHADSGMKEAISMFISRNMSDILQCDKWNDLLTERPILANKFLVSYASMTANK